MFVIDRLLVSTTDLDFKVERSGLEANLNGRNSQVQEKIKLT